MASLQDSAKKTNSCKHEWTSNSSKHLSRGVSRGVRLALTRYCIPDVLWCCVVALEYRYMLATASDTASPILNKQDVSNSSLM